MLTQLEFEKILGAGVAAPSADNRHRFRARQTDEGIILTLDVDLREEAERHRKILTLIGMGAVIENMCIQASALNIALEPEVFSQATGVRDFALLRSHRGGRGRADPLAQFIDARCTNRRMYRREVLTPAERAGLDGALADLPGARLQWLADQRAKRQALRLIWMAESERFLRKALHAELFEAVRFDVGWAQTASESLPAGSLEIERALRPFFKALGNWGVMRALNVLGMHKILGLRAGMLPCWQAPGLGVVVVDAPDAETRAVLAGRAFERVWLQATCAGLALQPLAASTVLPLQEQLPGGARPDVQQALAAGWSRLMPEGFAMMVFRVGRAAPPSVRTTRPPVSCFVD